MATHYWNIDGLLQNIYSNLCPVNIKLFRDKSQKLALVLGTPLILTLLQTVKVIETESENESLKVF